MMEPPGRRQVRSLEARVEARVAARLGARPAQVVDRWAVTTRFAVVMTGAAVVAQVVQWAT